MTGEGALSATARDDPGPDQGDARTWALLGCGVAAEVCASLSLKGAMDQPALYLVVACGYVASFAFLTTVLKRGFGLGVAYGIWGACGVALTAGFSAALFDERVTAVMGLGFVVVVSGMVMVQFGREVAGVSAEVR